MKGKRNHDNLGRDDSGAIGVGTMIVFIAMVIVAAVAAAVLIQTAGTLERKSSETGEETTEEVSGNIFVRDIIGNISDSDNDGTDSVEKVWWYISLAPGAEPVDLSEMVLRWEHGSDLADAQHNTGTCSQLSDGFCVIDVFDAGDGDASVLSAGDRVRLEVALNASAGEDVGTRAEVNALLIPEKGSPVTASFKTPATFGTKSNVSLT